MEKCIKCGGTLPAGAKLCPYCGNPVSLYEEKKQPVQPASRKQARGRTILILAVVVLSGLLILSFAFAIILWSAPPKLAVSPGSLDYGTLQVGSQGSQILTLSNSGRQDLDWRAVKGKADWLTLDPSQGRIPSGGSQTINVRADTTLLTAGQYSASISFISNGGEASVSAILIVASGPVSPSGPVVSSISPTSGPATGGTTVTIIGSGFTGASKVLFGTATSTFTVNSDTQITVVSPAGSGTVHVTVTTPGGPSATSTADQFTYLVVPKIMSISPTSGPAAGGTTVTIRGEGLTGASKVLFGTVPARSFTVNSATQITALSPAGSGTVDVTVTTPGGTSATSTTDRFTYVYVPAPVPVPFIKSISPTLGPVTGGTTVTITGTDLTGASKVLFGTVPAKTFTRVSATQITAVSPAGSGTVDVTVTTPGGTSKTSNADRFTYVPAPMVTGVSPSTGPTTGGTKVTITGSGFTTAIQVKFGNVAASNPTRVSDKQIKVDSPVVTGSGTVDVRVTTPGGTSAISNADRFTYLKPPHIAVAQTSLDFGPLTPPATKNLPDAVKNTGGQPLQWKVTVDPATATWVTVLEAPATVAPGGQQVITVTANTTGLTPGDHTATLHFDSTNGGGSVTVSVKLTVTVPPGPHIAVAQTSLDFGPLTPPATKNLPDAVKNTGGQPLDWKVTASESWVTVLEAPATVTPGGQQDITVRVDSTGLTPGDHTATLHFDSTNGGGSIDVTVNMVVP